MTLVKNLLFAAAALKRKKPGEECSHRAFTDQYALLLSFQSSSNFVPLRHQRPPLKMEDIAPSRSTVSERIAR